MYLTVVNDLGDYIWMYMSLGREASELHVARGANQVGGGARAVWRPD